MSDLWTEATHDAEAERLDQRVTAARVATVEFWPFLAAATSWVDYDNRKALIADRIDRVVSSLTEGDPVEFGVVRSTVESSLDDDFRVISEQRVLEEGRQVAAARKTAVEYGDRAACSKCDLDIEFVDDGWWDRGGNFSCPKGGQHEPYDPEGRFARREAPRPFGDSHRQAWHHTAPGGGTHAPYRIEQDGSKWKVVNDNGEVKGTHDSKEEAREQQKALYANVPGASEQAEKKSSAKTAGGRTHVSGTCPNCGTSGELVGDGEGRVACMEEGCGWAGNEDDLSSTASKTAGEKFSATVECPECGHTKKVEVDEDHPEDTFTCPNDGTRLVSTTKTSASNKASCENCGGTLVNYGRGWEHENAGDVDHAAKPDSTRQTDASRKRATRKTAGTVTVNGREFDYDYGLDQLSDIMGEGTYLEVILYNPETNETVDTLGGVDAPSLQVSDHGNVNISPEDEAYVRSVAEEMASNHVTGTRKQAVNESLPEGFVDWVEQKYYDDIRLSYEDLERHLEELSRNDVGAYSEELGRWVSTYEALLHEFNGGATGNTGAYDMSIGGWVDFPARTATRKTANCVHPMVNITEGRNECFFCGQDVSCENCGVARNRTPCENCGSTDNPERHPLSPLTGAKTAAADDIFCGACKGNGIRRNFGGDFVTCSKCKGTGLKKGPARDTVKEVFPDYQASRKTAYRSPAEAALRAALPASAGPYDLSVNTTYGYYTHQGMWSDEPLLTETVTYARWSGLMTDLPDGPFITGVVHRMGYPGHEDQWFTITSFDGLGPNPRRRVVRYTRGSGPYSSMEQAVAAAVSEAPAPPYSPSYTSKKTAGAEDQAGQDLAAYDEHLANLALDGVDRRFWPSKEEFERGVKVLGEDDE